MKRQLQIMAVLALAVLAISIPNALLTGCATKLAPGGAYAPVTTNADGTVTATQAPEKVFFEIDSAFDLAYAATDAAFKFERDNRAALWTFSPSIKHTLDGIRPQASDAVKRYAAARKAYLANPVPANLDTLSRILAEAQALTSAATAALPGK